MEEVDIKLQSLCKNQKGQFRPVLIFTQNDFTPEIDQLRQICFPSIVPVVTAKDEFDERSQHIIVQIQGKVAAYGRLTPGPNAVFEKWMRGKATIPTGTNTIDLSRCLVSPDYRGLGLLDLVFLAGLNVANEQGYHYVVGSVIPHEKVGPKLYRLGFVNAGKPLYEDEPNEPNILVQPLMCDITKSAHLWSSVFLKQKAYLQSKGYDVAELIMDLL